MVQPSMWVQPLSPQEQMPKPIDSYERRRDEWMYRAAENVLAEGGEPAGPGTFRFHGGDHFYPCIHNPRLLFRLVGVDIPPALAEDQVPAVAIWRNSWEDLWPLSELPLNTWVRLRAPDSGQAFPLEVLVKSSGEVFGRWISP